MKLMMPSGVAPTGAETINLNSGIVQSTIIPLYTVDWTAYSSILRIGEYTILLDCGLDDSLDITLMRPLIQYVLF